MKNILLILIVIISAYTVGHSQFDSKKLYMGFGSGLTYSDGKINPYIFGSIKANIKVGYKLNQKCAVGAEFSHSYGLDAEDLQFEIYKMNRFLVSSRYTFLTSKITPFVELSAGLAHVKEPNLNGSGTQLETGGTRFGLGGSAELGLSIYNFFVSYSYDLYGKTPLESNYDQRSENISIQHHALQVGYMYHFDYFYN